MLREDGERRQQAAHARERGLRLRDQAEQTAEQADARLQERERRGTTSVGALARRPIPAAARLRRGEQEKQQAARTESRRREAARKAAAHHEQAIETRAPRETLETLDAKNDAFRAREQELAARDEARRLAEAASQAKAERKAD